MALPSAADGLADGVDGEVADGESRGCGCRGRGG